MTLPPVQRFTTNTGVTIYRISCQAFPTLVVHCYVLVGAGPVTLIDTGSGYGDSTRQLYQGLDSIGREFGTPITVHDIKRIIITHGHIDHFGGLAQVHGPVTAEVGIHELDRWVLTSYEERVIVATKALRFFLDRAGVPAARQQALMDIYTYSRRHVHSMPVDFTIVDGQELDGLRFIHTPGHCPGQVCIAVGDVLLSADHVLPKTTPHQSPESITASTGLRHYLEALTKIERESGFRLALGGHEDPIENLAQRIVEIRADHRGKLDRILALLEQHPGSSMWELTELMYPWAKEWHVLLAIEEVGAHVEYLYEHGALAVTNLDQVAREENPALRFRVH
jgi:glyoxylase-like metal-dependent hydrolase (beta-lactamase superfamily II)